MKRLSLILAAFSLVLGACERHTWEDVDQNKDGVIDQNEKGTKRLYAAHGEEATTEHPKEGEKVKGAGDGGEGDAAHKPEEKNH